MANKKYFWLKLKDDFFKKREIKKLRRLAGGDTYTIIYLQMQLLAIKSDGIIYFEGTEKDIFEQLELELDEDIENIKMTVHYLMHNNLLEINEKDDCFLPDTLNCIGKETESAERVRKHREKNKIKQLQSNEQTLHCNMHALQCNSTVTKRNTEIEIEIDKDINKHIVHSDEMDMFEKLWNLYPRKEGKVRITKSKSKLNELYKIGFEELERAINRYKKTTTGKDKQYIKMGSTFFTTDYKDFLDKNYNEKDYESVKTATKNSSGHQANFKQRDYTAEDFEKYYYKITE